jgi:hypothetical protein
MLNKPLKVTTGLSGPDCRGVVVMSLLVWSFDILHPECGTEKLIAFKNHLDTVFVAMLTSSNFGVFV